MMAFGQKLREKYKELSANFEKQKQKYETERKAWAEMKAEQLEKQAQKDAEMLKIYQRQEKARATSQKLKNYKTKKIPSSGGALSGLGDFGASFSGGGGNSMLPFVTSGGKKGKKKKDDFGFLPRI
jgi:dsDNA-specific endonuclease/ATPase MutS2